MALSSQTELRARAWLESHGEPLDDVAALAFHLRARAALGHALARLDAGSIPALVVKGAVLAHTLYASPIDRPIRDVDLRVVPSDVARAGALLAAAPGARLLVKSRVYGTSVVSFERVEIDIESRVGPPFLCALSVASMLARAERTSEGLGFPYLRPEIHDHALLLMINLFKDRLRGTARWRLRDLQLVARTSRFDIDLLARRAAEVQCTTIAHIVARYVAESTGDDCWQKVAARIPPARPRYARWILATARGERNPGTLAWRLAVRAGSDRHARSFAALATSALREVELRAQQI